MLKLFQVNCIQSIMQSTHLNISVLNLEDHHGCLLIQHKAHTGDTGPGLHNVPLNITHLQPENL